MNNAPAAEDATLHLDEDTVFEGVAEAVDADGDTLSFTVTSAPKHGKLALDRNTGKFTYTPEADFAGEDAAVFTVSDGQAESGEATVKFTVKAVNDEAVAEPASASGNEDAVLSGRVSATDVDGDTLAYAVAGAPAHGAVTLDAATGAFAYTPDANYNGADSFTVKANDGTVDSNTVTVSLTVTPVADAPTAADANAAGSEDQDIAGTLAAADVDGDTLTYGVVTQPTNGALFLDSSTGQFVYTPNANANGDDSFAFKVNDGTADSNTAVVMLSVAAVNDAPAATNVSVMTDEDLPVGNAGYATDIENDLLTYNVVTQPVNGALSFASSGYFTYSPAANFHGSDAFTYVAYDGAAYSAVSTVTITVSPVNDAPIAFAGSVTGDEDGTLSGAVSAVDADGDGLTYAAASTPAFGTIAFNANGSFSYTPNANYNGADSFTFRATDGTAYSLTKTVTLTVNPVNDAPAAGNGSLRVKHNTATAGQLAGTDIEGSALTYAIASQPANGTVLVTANTGAYSYTPSTGFVGADTFTFTVDDGSAFSAPATVSVNVLRYNASPPVITPGQILVAAPAPNDFLTVLYTDADADTMTVTQITGVDNGTATGGLGGLSYLVAAPNAPGVDIITAKGFDGVDTGAAETLRVWLPGCTQDADGDGYGADCAQADPDDSDPLANPGAQDLYSGSRDQNGDGFSFPTANALYVDAVNGSDAYAGTASKPLRTLNYATYIQKPGQPIFVAKGTYTDYMIGPVGPIIGGFTPTWYWDPATNPTIVGTWSSDPLIYVGNSTTNIVLQGLTLIARSRAVSHYGNMTITDSKIITNYPQTGFASSAIVSNGGKFVMARCAIAVTGDTQAVGWFGSTTGGGMLFNNTITAATVAATGYAYGVRMFKPGTVMVGNRVGAAAKTSAYGVIASDGARLINNAVSAYGYTNNAYALQLQGNGRNVVVHNTLYAKATAYTIGAYVTATGINVLAGNLIQAAHSAVYSTTPSILRGNLLYAPKLLSNAGSDDLTIAAVNACVYPRCDVGAANITGDPLLQADGSLGAGSPAIDAAIDPSTYGYYAYPVGSSLNGVSRPQGTGWDIGAYEQP